MTKKALSLVVVVALAACFGSGPKPSKPSDAEIEFTPVQNNNGECGQLESFIDDVVFQGGSGFAAVAPVMINGNCSSGSNMPQAGGSVFSFPLDGSNPQGMMLAAGLGNLPGNGDSFPPRMAVAAVLSATIEPTWVWEPANQPLMIASLSKPGGMNLTASFDNGEGTTIAFVPGPAGSGGGLVFGNLGTNNNSFSDPSTPDFPCCNEGSTQQAIPGEAGPITTVGSGSSVSAAGWTSTNSVDLFRWTEIEPIAADSNSNFYYVSNQPALVEVPAGSGSGSGSAIAPLDPLLDQAQQTGIVFLPQQGNGSAGEVWTSFTPIPEQSNNASPSACTILSTDLAGGATTPALMTNKFSCWDLQTDGTFVYFAIVSIDCGECGSGAMRGIGIGRVSIGNHGMFESLATGVTELGYGPRRVFPQPDGTVFTADPFTIAKINMGALGGHHDFAL
jgi:hypothetical protein